MPLDRKAITQPRVIVCEGFFDVTFLQALASVRDLPAFDYRFPGGDRKRGGITSIGDELRGLAAATNFRTVEHVLVVVDCDTNAQANFQTACEQIEKGNESGAYTVPPAALEKAGANPTTAVALLPSATGVGDLETMCYNVITQNAGNLAQCVDAFANCVGANAWPASKQGKMKLEAFLAAHFTDNPQQSLGYAWWDLAQGPLPLDDPAFDEIANLMESYR